jgi:hypothetical protein
MVESAEADSKTGVPDSSVARTHFTKSEWPV